MPHTTETSNILFVFNSFIKSCHSNKKPNSGNGHVTDDAITLDVTWEGIYGKCYLVVVCLTVFHVQYCESYKAFLKISSKDSRRFFMILIIYFYNYYYYLCIFFVVVV